MRKVLSISLSSDRRKELGFLYAVLSILENKRNLKIIEVIDKALETTNKIIVERYTSLIRERREDIIKIMEEKFGIEDGGKIVDEFLERKLVK